MKAKIMVTEDSFLCTSHYLSCLLYAKCSNTFMYISADSTYALTKWKPGWKPAGTCKIYTFLQNFAGSCLKKYHLFPDVANSRLPLKRPLFLQKWVSPFLQRTHKTYPEETSYEVTLVNTEYWEQLWRCGTTRGWCYSIAREERMRVVRCQIPQRRTFSLL